MANLQYTADILADALFRAAEPTDGTSDYATQALVFLNNAYMQICRGGSELDPEVNEDWWWLLVPSNVINLWPPFTTINITATTGSTSFTLDTIPTDWTGTQISISRWYIKVDGYADLFRVSSHVAGALTGTFDAAFTGTSVSVTTCSIFLTDYDLASNVLRIPWPMRTYRTPGVTTAYKTRGDYKVYASTQDSLEDAYPRALVLMGVPDYYAPVFSNTTGTRTIRFNRCGGPLATDVYRVEYDFLQKPTPLANTLNEEPLLPREWRHILSDFTLAYILGAKHDDRAPIASQVAIAGLHGLRNENRYQTFTATRDYFRLRPRGTGLRHFLARTTSGLYIG